MTSHQVVFLLLDLALIVALARLFGTAARRLGQPPVLGEILAGILVGPTLFGNGFSAAVFPTDTRPMLAALANVCYCAAYFVDLPLQYSSFRAAWLRWRFALWLAGMLLATALANYWIADEIYPYVLAPG